MEYIRKLQIRRFTGDNDFQMQIDHFWPFPFCSGESDVFHQSQSFTQGFLLVAQKLLTILDTLKRQHHTDGEGTFAGFDQYIEGMKTDNVEESTCNCRVLQDETTAKLILAPIIDEYITIAKSQINSEYC